MLLIDFLSLEGHTDDGSQRAPLYFRFSSISLSETTSFASNFTMVFVYMKATSPAVNICQLFTLVGNVS